MADQAEELLDYLEDNEEVANDGKLEDNKPKTSTYSGVSLAGFRDFLLKPELMRAITDCGFEHPSEARVYSSGYPGR